MSETKHTDESDDFDPLRAYHHFQLAIQRWMDDHAHRFVIPGRGSWPDGVDSSEEALQHFGTDAADEILEHYKEITLEHYEDDT